jgi:hypothetical protein
MGGQYYNESSEGLKGLDYSSGSGLGKLCAGEHCNELNKMNQTNKYPCLGRAPNAESPYYSKAATSFSSDRAINMGSDSLKMARPQSGTEVKNECCYTSTPAYAFMACTEITDFHSDFVFP